MRIASMNSSANLFIRDDDFNLINDLELIGEDAEKVVQLGYRLREFNNNGQDLSDKVSQLPVILNSKLDEVNNSLSAEQKISLQSFFMDITESFTIISQLSDPFPEMTKVITDKPKLNFSDIIFCINVLHNRVVNPIYNDNFKTRAIQCVLLTLAYEKLLKSPIDVKDIANLLIIPMQRLTRISLFSGDGLKGFDSIKKCIDDKYFIQIENTFLQVNELNCRSAMIAIAVNEMKAAMDFVTNRISECKYNTFSRSMDAFTRKFVEEIVTYVMEAPIQDKSFFVEKIKQEYTNQMCSTYISLCDYLHHDFLNSLGKITTNRTLEINSLTNKLKEIHENSFLTDSEKLTGMKREIGSAYAALSNSMGSIFGPKRSNYLDFLSDFIQKEMIHYSEIVLNNTNDVKNSYH